jgi:hypothetical protein
MAQKQTDAAALHDAAHAPPAGAGARSRSSNGSSRALEVVQRIRKRYHQDGHVGDDPEGAKELLQ